MILDAQFANERFTGENDEDVFIPSSITDPVDDGSCDPLYGNRMDSADLNQFPREDESAAPEEQEVSAPLTSEQASNLLKALKIHRIDTERFRCSCGKPMCRKCGGCSGKCGCTLLERKGTKQ